MGKELISQNSKLPHIELRLSFNSFPISVFFQILSVINFYDIFYAYEN